MQMEISNEIKEKRKKLGLTQQELADLVGVNIRTIQRWEKESQQNIINIIKLITILENSEKED